MHLYRRVLQRAGLSPDTLRLAFVEPMASKSGTFWRHVGQLPVNASQVALMTAVIDETCPPFKRVFRLNPDAALQFDFDIQMISGWVSANRDHFMETVRTWLDSNAPVSCLNQTGDCRDNLRRLFHMRNASHYVEDVLMRCLTLEGLVREVGAEVEDLAMLVSDAEGTDARIILSLVGNEDFRPGFIMWEKNSKGDGQLVEELRKKGYQVGIKAGLDGSREVDAGNLVAVLS
uniref:Methyltransferase FkbM domain-containing protein n=1 Tax=Alexandrium catenella TaxID=2925 RepID=A0A6T9UAK4_ALECA